MPSLPEKSPPPGPLFFIEVRVLAAASPPKPQKENAPSRVRILNTFWFIAGGRGVGGGINSLLCNGTCMQPPVQPQSFRHALAPGSLSSALGTRRASVGSSFLVGRAHTCLCPDFRVCPPPGFRVFPPPGLRRALVDALPTGKESGSRRASVDALHTGK